MEPPIKIAITDDHPLVISGIEKILAAHPNFSIIDSFQTGEALLTGLKQRQPDVLLLDIQLTGINGDELAAIIHKTYPDIRILALTGFDTPFYVRSMLLNGCKGYLLKNTAQHILIEAIAAVYKGEQYIDSNLKEALLNNMLKLKKQKSSATPSLTEREKDILRLIVNEYKSPEIAKELFLSIRTVDNYRLHLMQKLKVKNAAGLVKAALELDLIS